MVLEVHAAPTVHFGETLIMVSKIDHQLVNKQNKLFFFQMRRFYETLEQKKERELRMDLENRKHHDTLL